MKHRFWIVLLTIAAALCLMFGLAACGEEWDYTEGLTYELDMETDTYTVTGIGTASGDIVVPHRYKGKRVTTIGDKAFFELHYAYKHYLPRDKGGMGEN